jgi:rubrerythrin
MLLEHIDSVAAFYARAIAIERDAAARYRELAQCMLVQDRRVLADLFRSLAQIESKHAENIARRAVGMPLPQVPPAQLQGGGLPQAEAADPLVTPAHALEIAWSKEELARAFFEQVAASSKHAEVKAIAREFAEDESAHGRLIRDMIETAALPALTSSPTASAPGAR